MATKKEMNKILLVLGILIVLFVGMLYIRFKRSSDLVEIQKKNLQMTTSVQTTPSVSLKPNYNGVIRILPPRINGKVGDTFEVTVQMEATGRVLDGADVHLKFDPTILEVADLLPGTYFSQYPRKTIDNVNGTIKVSAFSSLLLPKLSSVQTLLTLKVKAKRVGSDQLTVVFTQGKTSDSNLVEHKTSLNVLGKAENATIVVGE